VKKRIGEEFHGIISNMIGYEVGSSPVMVYTTAKTSSEANFKHNEKKRKKTQAHGCQHSNTFAKGVLLKVMFLGQSQTLMQ
jgi:hypothetical protein